MIDANVSSYIHVEYPDVKNIFDKCPAHILSVKNLFTLSMCAGHCMVECAHSLTETQFHPRASCSECTDLFGSGS